MNVISKDGWMDKVLHNIFYDCFYGVNDFF